MGLGIYGRTVAMYMWIFQTVIRKWVTKYFQLVYLRVVV